MKNFIKLCLFLVLFIGCEPNANEQTKILDKTPKPDTSKTVAPHYLSDPLREINNFAVNVNYDPLDKVIVGLNNNKNAVARTSANYSWGDCDGAYKKITDCINKAVLYLFKADCGEYGFSNDQFYFVSDNLLMARNYSFGIEEYPKDNIATKFYITEEIYYFSSDGVMVKKRKKVFTDNNKYSIDDVEFEVNTSGDRKLLLKEKTKEFKEQLELENSKDE